MAELKPDPNEEFIDALAEEEMRGNKEKGQEHLPKPADIIRQEEEAKKKNQAEQEKQLTDPKPQEKPTQESTEKKETPASKKPDEEKPDEGKFDIDTLLEKVTEGEELTEGEKQFLDEQEQEIDTETEDEVPEEVKSKEYKIAGKTYSFDDIEKQAREDLELTDVNLSANQRQKVVDSYFKSLNKTEQSKSVDKRSQELAKEREDITQERKELEVEKRAADKEWERIQNQKTRLEALANMGIKKQDTIDPDTGQVDPDKMLQYTKQQDAKDQLKEVAERQKVLQNERDSLADNLVRTQVLEFLQQHPEYETSIPLQEAIEKYQKGYELSEDDELRVIELTDILQEANKRNKPMSTAHRVLKSRNQIGVLPNSGSVQTDGQAGIPSLDKTTRQSDRKKLIARIQALKERKRKAPEDLSGGSGGRTPQGHKKTLARQIIEHDRKTLHGENNDSFLRDELGY